MSSHAGRGVVTSTPCDRSVAMQELKLCKEYDRRRVEWEARIEKMENNQKKK